MPERRLAASLVLGALLVLAATPVLAQVEAPSGEAPPEAPPETGPAAESEPAPAPSPELLELRGSTVRFVAPDGVVMRLTGGRRYLDTLELRPREMVNELTLDAYLFGIAEMPTSWPMEALKAQAVAARTYVWWSMRTGSHDGYDICATVACQVFSGAAVVEAPTGWRWAEAVRATSGEALVDGDGRPILARYFSTSGGRTYDNEDVFPSSGARPYLVGFDDPYDEVSPMHRWTASFTREQMDEILSRGATLSAVSPYEDIERVGAVDDQRARIRVTGRDGRQVEVGAVAFRDFVSRTAEQLYPDVYPGLREDGSRRLPATIPSSRFEVELATDGVVLRGRGWGHGVGMGQYGALGRAQDGASYDDILAVYYGGLRPAQRQQLPDRVRVGLTHETFPAGVRSDGPMRVEAGDVVLDDVLGTWTVDRVDGEWRVRAPQGHGQPLELGGTRVTVEGDWPGVAHVEVDVNKPVMLSLEVVAASREAGGDVLLLRELGVVEAGTHTTSWRFHDGHGSRLTPGDYLVTLVAQELTGERSGTPATVTLDPPPPRPVRPSTVPSGGGGDGPGGPLSTTGWAWALSVRDQAVLAAIGLLLVSVVVGTVVLVRRSR